MKILEGLFSKRLTLIKIMKWMNLMIRITIFFLDPQLMLQALPKDQKQKRIKVLEDKRSKVQKIKKVHREYQSQVQGHQELQ